MIHPDTPIIIPLQFLHQKVGEARVASHLITHMPFLAEIDVMEDIQLPGIRAEILTDTQPVRVNGIFKRSNGSLITTMEQNRKITHWIARGGHHGDGPAKQCPWGHTRTIAHVDDKGHAHHISFRAFSPLHGVNLQTTFYNSASDRKPDYSRLTITEHLPRGNGRAERTRTMTFVPSEDHSSKFALAEMTDGSRSAHRSGPWHYDLGKLAAEWLGEQPLWWTDPCAVTASPQELERDAAAHLKYGTLWLAGSPFVERDPQRPCRHERDVLRAAAYAQRGPDHHRVRINGSSVYRS